MTPLYQNLKMTPLDQCSRVIKNISRGPFANEYGDRIEDYSKVKSPLTNRLIKPYVTSETHGVGVFDWLVAYINNNFPYASSLLDIGCGAGELLSYLKDRYTVYGTTIHLGEVEYGRNVYRLADICPIDMRELNLYFKKESFDCIIAHCCLHFIIPCERSYLVNTQLYDLLSDGGKLIIVDYKGNMNTGVEITNIGYTDVTPFDYITMGTLTVLQK